MLNILKYNQRTATSLIWGGSIRIPRLRSHIVSNPQANATLSQAVPVIRGCRLRVYNC